MPVDKQLLQNRLTKDLELVEDESLGFVKQSEKKRKQSKQMENHGSEGRIKKPRKKYQVLNDCDYHIDVEKVLPTSNFRSTWSRKQPS